jgi:hypothetical protein
MNECLVLILVGRTIAGRVTRVTFVMVGASAVDTLTGADSAGGAQGYAAGVQVRVCLYRAQDTVEAACSKCYGGDQENDPDVVLE